MSNTNTNIVKNFYSSRGAEDKKLKPVLHMSVVDIERSMID